MEAPALQERLDLGIPASEITGGLQRILGSAHAEQPLTEPNAVRPLQTTVLAEPLDRIARELGLL